MSLKTLELQATLLHHLEKPETSYLTHKEGKWQIAFIEPNNKGFFQRLFASAAQPSIATVKLKIGAVEVIFDAPSTTKIDKAFMDTLKSICPGETDGVDFESIVTSQTLLNDLQRLLEEVETNPKGNYDDKLARCKKDLQELKKDLQEHKKDLQELKLDSGLGEDDISIGHCEGLDDISIGHCEGLLEVLDNILAKPTEPVFQEAPKSKEAPLVGLIYDVVLLTKELKHHLEILYSAQPNVSQSEITPELKSLAKENFEHRLNRLAKVKELLQQVPALKEKMSKILKDGEDSSSPAFENLLSRFQELESLTKQAQIDQMTVLDTSVYGRILKIESSRD